MSADWADDLLMQTKMSLGEVYGDTYNLLRPNYASAVSAEAAVSGLQGQTVHMAPMSSTYIEPKISGANIYSVLPTYHRDNILPGDVLELSTPSDAVTAVTVVNKEKSKEIVAIRTHNKGSIITQLGKTPLFTNVRFNYLQSVSQLVSGLNPELESTTDFTANRVVIFRRAGIKINMRFADQETKEVWDIKAITEAGSFLVLAFEGTGR